MNKPHTSDNADGMVPTYKGEWPWPCLVPVHQSENHLIIISILIVFMRLRLGTRSFFIVSKPLPTPSFLSLTLLTNTNSFHGPTKSTLPHKQW